MVRSKRSDTCDYPFREFNAMFAHGIDEPLRGLVADADPGDWSHVLEPDDGRPAISAATMDHFDRDWCEDADGYPGADAGRALFHEFKTLLLHAEEGKPIGALWTRSDEFSVSTHDLGGSYVVVVRSPRPPGGVTAADQSADTPESSS